MKFSDFNSLPSPLQSQVTYRDLAVGERLFRRGDAANNFFVLESGRLQVVCPTIGNKTATIQFALPGDIIGENAIYQDHYPFSAISSVPSRVMVFPSSLITTVLKEYPELGEDLLKILLEQVKYFQTNMELREIRAAHHRVLQYLRHNAQVEQKVVNIDRPLQDIAKQLGFTPATLSRALAKLENEGTITRKSNIIYLNDVYAA